MNKAETDFGYYIELWRTGYRVMVSVTQKSNGLRFRREFDAVEWKRFSEANRPRSEWASVHQKDS